MSATSLTVRHQSSIIHALCATVRRPYCHTVSVAVRHWLLGELGSHTHGGPHTLSTHSEREGCRAGPSCWSTVIWEKHTHTHTHTGLYSLYTKWKKKHGLPWLRSSRFGIPLWNVSLPCAQMNTTLVLYSFCQSNLSWGEGIRHVWVGLQALGGARGDLMWIPPPAS